jgi:membrane-bound inhibitor of C-type lysozyme
MIGETIQHETEESQQEELQKIIEISREEGKQEALQNLTAEQELSIAQNVIAKSGKKFLGSEGKYPFLSEAVNSDEQKLKRVSNLQQWEIEKIKTYTRLEMFLNKIGMTDFSKTVNSEKEEIMKLSTSKEGYLLQIAGTEAVISKNTQRVEEDRGKK